VHGILETLGVGTPQLLLLLQVLVAMGFGAVIGYDRQASYKPAGLRTHMLVSGASALFVGLAYMILRVFDAHFPNQTVRSDPIRVFEAIITGISFLGAGTIIRHRRDERVEGITTAASLLMTAAIGATVGLSEWFLALAVTAIVFVVLHLLGRLKWHQPNKRPEM
jgi:putative Mg2+ transporter-C (MgtC) family protein